MRQFEQENSHVVALNGGKRKEKNPEGARIEVEGETIELDHFIISGEAVDGKRVVLTYSCSPDEMTSHLKTLDVVVSKRIEQIMDIE